MLKYNVILKKSEEGICTATIPSLPGRISEGRTIKETLNNIQDAIKGYLIVLAKHNRPIPIKIKLARIQSFIKEKEIAFYKNLTKKIVLL